MADFLNDYSGEGLDNITLEDQTTPFLVILQTLSPQCLKDNDAYIKGAEPGLFFNTALKKLYGVKVNVIPLAMKKIWLGFHSNHIFFIIWPPFMPFYKKNTNICLGCCQSSYSTTLRIPKCYQEKNEGESV